MDWSLTSSAFSEGASIPVEYTCSGEDVSPPLSWGEPPEGTQQLALICDDPDAPAGTWVHWVIYAIPADCRELPRAFPVSDTVTDPVAAIQGENDFGATGYGGPCPPPGTPHRYFFTLYALSAPVSLDPGVTRAELDAAMDDKILAETALMGKFQR